VKIALISCSNGYGHVRRLMLIAQQLLSYTDDVVLFAPFIAAKQVQIALGVKYGPKIVDFNSKTSINNWQTGVKPYWFKKIQNLDDFDIVVSDNLIEVLEIRNDAWLSGSFFWHEIFNNFPSNLKGYYLDLLKKHNPKMISTSYFSQGYLNDFTRLYEVGIYGDPLFNENLNNKSDILISCGLGGESLFETKMFLEQLVKLDEVPCRRVWVEPSLYPKNSPKWMFKATYSHKMFDSLLASIIRPGVGTISDSLRSGVKIFSYFERDNLEMKKNTCFLEESELGVSSGSIHQAWIDANTYLKNKREQEFFLNSLKKIEFNGEKKASQILLNY
jgi:hypothetical protein